VVAVLVIGLLGSTPAVVEVRAQTAGTSEKPAFEVASVRANRTGDSTATANSPLGPGSVYVPSGGHFAAANFPLYTYIAFAYKLQGNQEQALRAQMPEWVLSEHYDIEARTDGNPAKDNKDRMRLMMRALLADRFKLAIHSETRQVPVFALVLLKPGKTGPWLQAHPENSCKTDPPPAANQIAGQFPALCGGLLPMPPAPGRPVKFGARNVTMPFIANQLTAMGTLDRPVFDQTGLTGNYDFALEWVPAPVGLQLPGADLLSDPTGPAFLDAVAEQLGLKLVSQKGPAEVLVLDHVEHPSGN
jgi:uncharacterized protein (TIGR03435 family)